MNEDLSGISGGPVFRISEEYDTKTGGLSAVMFVAGLIVGLVMGIGVGLIIRAAQAAPKQPPPSSPTPDYIFDRGKRQIDLYD